MRDSPTPTGRSHNRSSDEDMNGGEATLSDARQGRDVGSRYREAQELEKQLRSLLQSKGSFDPNVRALRNAIREAYEAVILEDHAFAEAHEVEQALWRLHYKRIEEFRARLRKSVQAAAAAATAPVIPMPGAKVIPRKEPVFKVLSVFKSFLSEATGFYHDLILKIRAKHGLPQDYTSFSRAELAFPDNEERVAEVKRVEQSCHRCLIFLGDLARYKELHGDGDPRHHDWSAAAGYYLQAANIWPTGGNPHNQMAVLATYVGDELLAVYRYFRSLAVDTPFLTARDNLILLFEKNRQHYAQLPSSFHDPKLSLIKREVPSSSEKGKEAKGDRILPFGDGALKLAVKDHQQAAQASSANIAEIRKSFRVRFVRLNGILFTRTSLETFSEVYAATVRELEQLLCPEDAGLEAGLGSDHRSGIGTGSAGSAGVLQLIATLIFTVHNVNWGPENHHPTYAEILQRSALHKHAFTAAFECAGRLMRRCGESADASESPLVPAMLVFMEWLACRPEMAVGSDVDEKQGHARAFFWRQCVSLLNNFSMSSKPGSDGGGSLEVGSSSLGGGFGEDESAAGVALWEDFELRGFTPLAPAQSALDYSNRPLRAGFGDRKEKEVRLRRLLAAGKAVAIALDGSGRGICFDEDSRMFFMAGERPERTVQESPEITADIGAGILGRVQDDTASLSLALKAVKVASSEVWSKPVSVDSQKSPVVPIPVAKILQGEEDEEVIVFKPVLKERQTATASAPNAWLKKLDYGTGDTSGQAAGAGNMRGVQSENDPFVGSHLSTIQSFEPKVVETVRLPDPPTNATGLPTGGNVSGYYGLQQSTVPTVVGTAASVALPNLSAKPNMVNVASDPRNGPTQGVNVNMNGGAYGSQLSSALDWLNRMGAEGYQAPSLAGWNVDSSQAMFDNVNADKYSAAGVIGQHKLGVAGTSWSTELEALATIGMSGNWFTASTFGESENGLSAGVASMANGVPAQPSNTAGMALPPRSLPYSSAPYVNVQSGAMLDKMKVTQNGGSVPIYPIQMPLVARKQSPRYAAMESMEKSSNAGASLSNASSAAFTAVSSSNTWMNKDVQSGSTWVRPSGIRPPPGFGPLPSKPVRSNAPDTQQALVKARAPLVQHIEGEQQVDDYSWLDDYDQAKATLPTQSGFQGQTSSSFYSTDFGIWGSVL